MNPDSLCSKHPLYRVERNCKECKKVGCQHCMDQYHQGHDTESVKEGLDRIKASTPLLTNLEKHRQELEASITQISKYIQECRENKDATKQAIQNHKNELKARISNHSSRLLKAVEESVENQLQNLEMAKNDFKNQFKSHSDLILNTDKALAKRDYQALVALQDGLHDRVLIHTHIYEAVKNFKDLEETDFRVVEFNPRVRIDNIIGNITTRVVKNSSEGGSCSSLDVQPMVADTASITSSDGGNCSSSDVQLMIADTVTTASSDGGNCSSSDVQLMISDTVTTTSSEGRDCSSSDVQLMIADTASTTSSEGGDCSSSDVQLMIADTATITSSEGGDCSNSGFQPMIADTALTTSSEGGNSGSSDVQRMITDTAAAAGNEGVNINSSAGQPIAAHTAAEDSSESVNTSSSAGQQRTSGTVVEISSEGRNSSCSAFQPMTEDMAVETSSEHGNTAVQQATRTEGSYEEENANTTVSQRTTDTAPETSSERVNSGSSAHPQMSSDAADTPAGNRTGVGNLDRRDILMASLRQTKLRLKKIEQAKLTRVETLDLDTSFNRLCYVNNNLWCFGQNGILKYDIDDNEMGPMDIPIMETALSVHPFSDKYVLVATKDGLYQMTTEGKEVVRIIDGCFKDVHGSRDYIAALKHIRDGKDRVHLLDFNILDRNKLEKGGVFNLKTDYNISLKVVNRCIYVSSYCKDRERYYVSKCTTNGTSLRCYGRDEPSEPGYLNTPYLCASDTEHSILVADSKHCRLQVLYIEAESDENWSICNLPDEGDRNKPTDVIDVVISPREDIYVLVITDVKGEALSMSYRILKFRLNTNV